MSATEFKKYHRAPFYPKSALAESQIPDGYAPLTQVCDKFGLDESWVMLLIFEEPEPHPIFANLKGEETIMARPADLYSYIQHFLPVGMDRSS